VEREDANVLAYNSPVTARLLLGGHVETPSWAAQLVKTLEACTGLPGNRQWINDQPNHSPGGGSYVFGGLASPGSGSSSSFFRRKKKENPNFPPASWGVETNGGSYFADATPHSHSRNMTWNGTSPLSSSMFESGFEGATRSAPFSGSQLNSEPETTNPFMTLHTSTPQPSLTLPPPHRRKFSLNLPNTNHVPFP
jgi:hypothetical protein